PAFGNTQNVTSKRMTTVQTSNFRLTKTDLRTLRTNSENRKIHFADFILLRQLKLRLNIFQTSNRLTLLTAKMYVIMVVSCGTTMTTCILHTTVSIHNFVNQIFFH